MNTATRVRLLEALRDGRIGTVIGPGQLPGEWLIRFDDQPEQDWHIQERWLEVVAEADAGA